MDLDHKLCYCFHISKRKIVNFIKQTTPKRASQISECFGAGSGCGWCVPFLKDLHRQVMAGEVNESDDVSPADYEAMRKGYLSDVKEGTRHRNRHDDRSVPRVGKEAVDYTGYFSRSRPDPSPDDLGGTAAVQDEPPDDDTTDSVTQ